MSEVEEDGGATVLRLRVVPPTEKAPVEFGPGGEAWHRCRHHEHGVVVDIKKRAIECGDCGAVLDPVDVLIEMANKYRQLRWRYNALTEAEKKLAERERKKAEKKFAVWIGAFLRWAAKGERPSVQRSTPTRDPREDGGG